jgi:subtilisin family serine protease
MKGYRLLRVALLSAFCLIRAFAQNGYLFRVNYGSGYDVASRDGATIIRALTGSGTGLYVMTVPAGPLGNTVVQAVAQDPQVAHVETDASVVLPEVSAPTPATSPLPTLVDGYISSNYYGTLAWGPYINQPAASVIKVSSSHTLATGAGIVATIDTGVDYTHPALMGAIDIWLGWDFTRSISGGSENPDLPPTGTALLAQETSPILDGSGTVILNQETSPILDQTPNPVSTSTIPLEFGHGTMVAGLIHLVAPTAKIMPLKVFASDGTSTVSLVVAAIYWASDNGADVINMSFSTPQSSQELARAISYANSKGVICVAAAGNNGQQTMVYPAGYSDVIGTGSTNNSGVRSSFSNYGPVVTVAAPGEGVISTYPMNRYASGWGTSFSTPWVSGAAALLQQINSQINQTEAVQAISQAVKIGQGLGAGELDLVGACSYEARIEAPSNH